LVVALTLIPWAAEANSGNPWKKDRRDCITLLAKGKKVESRRFEQCADRFGAYAQIGRLSPRERSRIKTSLRRLYERGSKRAAWVARDGLFRFGIKLPVRTKRGDKAIAKGEQKYNPPPVGRAARKKAQALAKKGISALNRNKNSQAEATLNQAVGVDPRCVSCIYNLACAYSKLKKRDKALMRLKWLGDLAGKEAIGKLIKARTDGDFRSLRGDTGFKRVTGYMQILVINTIGEPGEEAMENIGIMLKEMGHARPSIDDNDDELENPMVIFKSYAKAQTAAIAGLLNHPRVQIKPFKGKSKYDIIIRWGARMGDGGAESSGPRTVDGAMEAARERQNQVLAKPDAAVAKVDKVVSKPGNVYTSVTKGADKIDTRAKKTYEGGKGIVDKVTDISDKISSL
jgi:tetratricopeptide (TPR) repeat protein